MYSFIMFLVGMAATGLFGLIVMCIKFELELKVVDDYIKTLELD